MHPIYCKLLQAVNLQNFQDLFIILVFQIIFANFVEITSLNQPYIMKKRKLLFFIFLCVGLTAAAQYYGNYQNQQAYEWGRQMAEQMQKQQQQQNQAAYNMGYAMGLVESGKQAIANSRYTQAFEYFEKAYDEYDYVPALECLGICWELGIGCDRDTEWAKLYYKEGASKNNYACRQALQRINSNGYYPASYRDTFLRNFKANYQAQYSGGGSYPSTGGGSYNSGSSSGSGSAYSKCRICGGGGTCTSCNGSGGSWRSTGYYTGSGSESWINCPSCNGSKKCFNCHGTGRQ